jgi:phospholipid transport system transporter-binding protein
MVTRRKLKNSGEQETFIQVITMDLPVLEQHDDGCLMLKGVLTMQTVPALEKQARPLFDGSQGKMCIDLAAVQHADSSALALLLEWQRLARRLNIVVTYRNLPHQLMQIAQVSELPDILPIETA